MSFVSYLPRFSIQTISVSGAQKTSPRLISDYVETVVNDGSYHLLSRSNMFLYPRAAIEKSIVGYFPRIASARVSRSLPFSTEVKIEVDERQPFALWCPPAEPSAQAGASGSCYQMDEGGFIFAEASGIATTTEYIFEGGLATSSMPIGQTFVPARLPGVLALLRSLGQASFEARGAVVENDQDFSIPLVRGFTLKASFGEDAGTLIKNLELVLSSDSLKGKEDQLEYVDLRFGNKVYYKLRGESQSASTAQ